MDSSRNISQKRAFVRAWHIVSTHAFVALVSYVVAGLSVAFIALEHRADPAFFSRLSLGKAAIAVVFGSGPAALALFAAGNRYKKARWPSGLSKICARSHVVTIAAALRDGSTAVVIEGRVMRTGEGAELRAPLSGAPCAYHRVRVEEWDPHPRRGIRRPTWSKIHDRALLQPFVVTDDSGFVHIEPLGPEQDSRSPAIDPVDFDLDSVQRVTVHQSSVGVLGLTSEARAYVEASLEHRAERLPDGRLRVIEVCLKEGDTVSLFGTIKERVAPPGSCGDEGAQPIGVMSGFQKDFRVVPASLAEIRWLEALHRSVIAGLFGTGICLLAVVAVGLATLLGH